MIWSKVMEDLTPADWLSQEEVLEILKADMNLTLISPGKGRD